MTQAAALTTFPGNSISRVTRASLAASRPNKTTTNIRCLDVQKSSVSRQHDSGDRQSVLLAPVSRRNTVIALGILGLNVGEKNDDAWAAAKRPPPRPPAEKKDPNVNGVLAKVIASKKRKEAMKEEMARQRERGKKIEE